MYAVMIAAIRFAAANLPTIEIVFFRNAIAIVLLLPWLARVGVATLRTDKRGKFLARAGFSFLAMLTWFYAVSVVPLADAVALHFTLPLFTVMAVAWFAGERVGVFRWSATVVGFAGALVIVRPGFAAVDADMAIVLASAALYAGSNVFGKILARTEAPALIVFYLNLMMLPMAFIPTLYWWVTPLWSDVPWLLAVGLSGTAAHICQARAFRLADASAVMPFDFLRLPFAALLGIALFAEWPDAPTLLGAAIIFASSVYIARREALRARA